MCVRTARLHTTTHLHKPATHTSAIFSKKLRGSKVLTGNGTDTRLKLPVKSWRPMDLIHSLTALCMHMYAEHQCHPLERFIASHITQVRTYARTYVCTYVRRTHVCLYVCTMFMYMYAKGYPLERLIALHKTHDMMHNTGQTGSGRKASSAYDTYTNSCANAQARQASQTRTPGLTALNDHMN